MWWGFFLSIAAHQGELDLDLLHWITDLLDDVLGLSDWAVVAIMGAAILAIPVLIAVFYLVQRRRGSYNPSSHNPSSYDPSSYDPRSDEP